MKKRYYRLLLAIICWIVSIQATSGTIKQDSVIECNGIYYGNHGNPTHWHMLEKKDGKWISISSEVEIPACYITPINEKELVVFSKCVDGDTARFLINGEEKIVRFLAIDTPESVHPEKEKEAYSLDASSYTCNALKEAKEIYLEYDGNSDKEDKYGRILAFVYVDGELLEEKLIEKGYAKVAYIYGDYAHVEKLREVEQIAKNKKIGIWNENSLGDTIDNKQDEVNIIHNDEKEFIVEIIKYVIELLKKLIDLILN